MNSERFDFTYLRTPLIIIEPPLGDFDLLLGNGYATAPLIVTPVQGGFRVLKDRYHPKQDFIDNAELERRLTEVKKRMP